jgi:aromatic-L-amino-acid decarboxylase
MAHADLADDSLLDAPWCPDLSTVVARVRGDDDTRTDRLVRRINHDHGLILSSTRIRGRLYLRLCILLPATHRPDVKRVLDIIHTTARKL